MIDKEFTLTNPEGSQTWTPSTAQWECLAFEFRLDLECMSVGEALGDEDGFVWKRIK